MSFVAGSLADGQVASSVGSIYTSTGVKTIVKSATFFNTNATAQTLNVYVTRSGGTRRQLYRDASMAQYTSFDLLSQGEVLVLSAGDSIDADTTTASAVDYVITGATNAS